MASGISCVTVTQALGFDRSSVPYEDQEASLGVAGYALWDVLSERQGPGSLDSQTVPGSDRPNDIEGLLLAVQTIHRVCINSKATAHFFRRHHRDWLQKPQTWSDTSAHAHTMPRSFRSTCWLVGFLSKGVHRALCEKSAVFHRR